jgi:hypothetical protein
MRRALLVAALLAGGCATRLLDATDGGTDTDGGAVQYFAYQVPTNVPRLSVQKVDSGNQRCTTALLIGAGAGMPAPPGGATLPSGWSIERAWQQAITNGACAQLNPPTGANMPISITGVFTFDALMPTTVTVHSTLNFPGGLAEPMDADNLPIKPGM